MDVAAGRSTHSSLSDLSQVEMNESRNPALYSSTTSGGSPTVTDEEEPLARHRRRRSSV